MSKEDILDIWIDISIDNLTELNYGERADGIYAAMEQYAKQQAIEFAEFSGHYTAIRGDKPWMKHDAPFTKYTSEELYNLFINHKTKEQ